MNPPSRFQIRDARDDEWAAIRDLTLAAYAEYATIMSASGWAALRQALYTVLDAEDAPAQRIVAERDGALVGSVLLYPAAANAYGEALAGPRWPKVRLLAVLPAVRGQGVGTALMGECVRRARRAGATALGLHTSESMQVALRLYERMGFARAAAYDFRPDGAELVMAYRLSLGSGEAGFGGSC
jgi:GNAT superfamily N-acetyltransferase